MTTQLTPSPHCLLFPHSRVQPTPETSMMPSYPSSNLLVSSNNKHITNSLSRHSNPEATITTSCTTNPSLYSVNAYSGTGKVPDRDTTSVATTLPCCAPCLPSQSCALRPQSHHYLTDQITTCLLWRTTLSTRSYHSSSHRITTCHPLLVRRRTTLSTQLSIPHL